MAEQHHKADTQLNKKPTPKVELVGSLDSPVELAALSESLTALDSVSLQDQAAQLNDPRLLVVQRQALASQIGQGQGNQHLQRVIASDKSSEEILHYQLNRKTPDFKESNNIRNLKKKRMAQVVYPSIQSQNISSSIQTSRIINDNELNIINELIMNFEDFDYFLKAEIPSIRALSQATINRLNVQSQEIRQITDRLPPVLHLPIPLVATLAQKFQQYIRLVNESMFIRFHLERDDSLRGILNAFQQTLQQASTISGVEREIEAQQIRAYSSDLVFDIGLFITSKDNKNVIYEISNNRRRQSLTYPNQRGRSYYSEEDVILTGIIYQRQLLDIFEELRPTQEQKLTITRFLAGIFMDEPSYKLGWRIKKISPANDARGGGQIECRAVLYFSDTDEVELKEIRNWSRDQLVIDFHQHQVGQSMMELVPILERVAELATLPGSGSLRTLGRRTGRRILAKGARAIINRALRRLFVKFLRFLRGSVSASIRSFLKTLAQDLARQRERNQIRNRANHNSASSLNVQAAIERAAASAATTLISKTLGQRLTREIQRAINEIQQVDPILGATLRQRIAGYVTRKIIALFTIHKLEIIIQAVSKAHARSLNEEGTMFTFLMEELGNELRSVLDNEINSFAEGFADHIDI